MANIKVCVRVRPFISREETEGDESGGRRHHVGCVQMPTKTRVEIYSHDANPKTFEFDRCYWSCTTKHPYYATQETLAEELGVTMLDHAMSGFNNCIFAYGQTGSGKSHSVLGGSGTERGLLPRVVEGLFEHLNSADGRKVRFKTFVAFLEIYNEQIRDLLTPDSDHKEAKLEVKQHPVLGTVIPGLTEAAVNNIDQVNDLIKYGLALRHVSATAMNTHSSRSHCIFTFQLNIRDRETGQTKTSQTHLVDLAGSERQARTKTTGDRLKEGAMINQSLSTLARVISALAKKDGINPPFRNSKLTHILKESLCGNSKTVMMAAISPSFQDYDETLSTLRFAQSVKQVQTHAVVNEIHDVELDEKLKKYVDSYRKKLEWYEAEKSSDKRRISMLQRRLADQEELVRRRGIGDGEELLLAERRRDTQRKSTLAKLGDAEELKKLVRKMRLEKKQQKDGEKNGSGGSSDDDSGSSSSSSSSSSSKNGLRVPFPDETELSLLTSGIAEVMLILQAHGGTSLRLQAMAAVDTDHPATSHLVVHVSRRATSQPADGAADDAGTEWLSAQQLHARLTWLRDAVERGEGADSHTCLWTAAAAALTPQPSPARRPSNTAEMERLRAQLAAMQVELHEVQRRLTREEATVAALRSELEAERQAARAGPRNAGGDAQGETCGPNARSLAAAVAASFADAINALNDAQVALQGSASPAGKPMAGAGGPR